MFIYISTRLTVLICLESIAIHDKVLKSRRPNLMETYVA